MRLGWKKKREGGSWIIRATRYEKWQITHFYQMKKGLQVFYLPGIGPQETQTIAVMCRKRGVGWLQRCSLHTARPDGITPLLTIVVRSKNFLSHLIFWTVINPFFHVIQIPIRTTAGSAGNTLRFSPFHESSTLSSALSSSRSNDCNHQIPPKHICFLLLAMSSRECPRGLMVKALDCGIVVSEFELQSRHYVYFRTNTLGKGMNPLILPAMG